MNEATKSVKSLAAQFGACLGGSIHSIKQIKLDPSAVTKDDAFKIVVQPTVLKMEHTKVNQVAVKQITGGVDVVVVNGGDSEIIVGGGDTLVKTSEGLTFTPEKRTLFGNAETPKNIILAVNNAEIARLEAIIASCKTHVDMIKEINNATELAASHYDND